jgi:multisubunit Na+/H+ antiporter MnhC subunit
MSLVGIVKPWYFITSILINMAVTALALVASVFLYKSERGIATE